MQERVSEPRERPIVNLEGPVVALGPLRRDLLSRYQQWGNDLATTRTLANQRPVTAEQIVALLDQLAASESDVQFTVYERSSWRPIGFAYLTRIDHRNRSAEYGIVIGEAECRGKGYGTEVTRLVLEYAFATLGLHNVMLRVYEYNLAGRRAYEKAGFREFGRRRQCHWLGDRLWDEILMECLASEFAGGLLTGVLAPDEPRSGESVTS